MRISVATKALDPQTSFSYVQTMGFLLESTSALYEIPLDPLHSQVYSPQNLKQRHEINGHARKSDSDKGNSSSFGGKLSFPKS